jgi:hypothetical protein
VLETKPFKAASTRVLNILNGRDLAIVLRLLTLAVSVCLALRFLPSLLPFNSFLMYYTDSLASGGVRGAGSGGTVISYHNFTFTIFGYLYAPSYFTHVLS